LASIHLPMNPPPPLALPSSHSPTSCSSCLSFCFLSLTPPLLFCYIFLYFCSLCTFLFSFISFCGMYGERLLCQGLWGASMDRFRIRQEYHYQPYHIGSDPSFRKDIHSLFCSSYGFTVCCRLFFSLFLLLVPLMFLLLCVSLFSALPINHSHATPLFV